MSKCKECNSSFIKKHFNSVFCSNSCFRIRRNRTRKSRNTSLGYSNKECVVCNKIFKPKTSTHLSCSDSCSLILRRRSKNFFQKKYHKQNNSKPHYILGRVLRTCIRRMIKNKRIKSKDYCDFSPKEFKHNIESKFQPGMSWNNWGKWHIDHIIPLSKFSFFDENGKEKIEEILRANALNNLRPLWAIENLRKHNKCE